MNSNFKNCSLVAVAKYLKKTESKEKFIVKAENGFVVMYRKPSEINKEGFYICIDKLKPEKSSNP